MARCERGKLSIKPRVFRHDGIPIPSGIQNDILGDFILINRDEI